MKHHPETTRHHGTVLPPRVRLAVLQPSVQGQPRHARASTTIKDTQPSMPAFSPLVQEFLDECGYSDK